MFSVIIPSFNKIDCIEKTIRSVLNQTFNDFEIIVVDDGSTDGSINFLKDIEKTDNRLKVFFQKNSGVSITRNNGVNNSKNNFIAFLDADDWWEPNYLEEMKNLIEAFPDAGLYSSSFAIVKNNKKNVNKFKIEDNLIVGYINYFQTYIINNYRQPINSSTVIIPKPIFKQYGGFPDGIKLGEDFLFWTKIALNEQIAYCNKPLSNYNQDSNIEFRATKKIHFPENSYVYYFSEFKKFEDNDANLKKLLDHIRLGNYRNYVRTGKFSEYAKELLKDVDMSKIPFFSRMYYKIPPNLLRFLILIEIYFITFKKKIYLLNPYKKK